MKRSSERALLIEDTRSTAAPVDQLTSPPRCVRAASGRVSETRKRAAKLLLKQGQSSCSDWGAGDGRVVGGG
jgi:hypothetical protein